MKVTVKFFSFLQRITGETRLSIELPERAALSDLVSVLHRQFNGLASVMDQVVLLVNQQSVAPETVLREGDDVLLLPFLGGG